MAEHIQNTNSSKDEHGSTLSYVIGYILSLILTIIAYYAVTRQVVSGKTLLIGIIALAAVQMFVQIFFFLHLGRGPKPLYNVVFFVATATFITVVVGASLLIMDNLYRNMSPQEVTTRLAQDENIAEVNGKPTGACQGNVENHIVVIENDMVNPQHIQAKRCDTLTIKIEDGVERTITFGTPVTPVSYGGLDEVTVRSTRSEIITLNEVGSFGFYDTEGFDSVGHFVVEQ